MPGEAEEVEVDLPVHVLQRLVQQAADGHVDKVCQKTKKEEEKKLVYRTKNSDTFIY
jgi:hypothetical protein